MKGAYYYVILHRPLGSQTWTPLHITRKENQAGNFFPSPTRARNWIDESMPEKRRSTFLPGPKKWVPVEFMVGKVVKA